MSNKKEYSFKKKVIFTKDGHPFDWLSVSDEDISHHDLEKMVEAGGDILCGCWKTGYCC